MLLSQKEFVALTGRKRTALLHKDCSYEQKRKVLVLLREARVVESSNGGRWKR